MLKKSTVQIAATAFALVLFLSFNALAQNEDKKAPVQTSQIKCSATTDADIVKAVQEQLGADSDIKDQMRHINVSVKNRTVTLEGWLDGKAAVVKAISLVKKTKCAKKVISRLKEQGGGSCGPRQKPCGDVCIDKSSVCNINTQ